MDPSRLHALRLPPPPLMFSALDLDIRPGIGLGIFDIGASLWSVLDALRTDSAHFPQIDIKYDPDAPLSPVLVHVRPHLDLLFSAAHQRLHTIALRRLHDHPPLTLRYKGNLLAAPDKDLRRVDVSLAFGPTYPGDDLRYPGVRFCFSDDAPGNGPAAREDRTQQVNRILIGQSESDTNVADRDALGEVDPCPIMNGELAEVVAKAHDGVVLRFYPETNAAVHVRLGVTTAQDLVCDLGSPIRTFYKEDDRMAIHSRTRTEEEGSEPSYFYNYFQYGMDFLLSGSTHVVKKIILHTNTPGSPMFQRYKRCPWQIEGRPEDDEDGACAYTDTDPHSR
ncbi:hypothetical protein OF83DRAFT_1103606 [Amylostereum chailletii]|nr:hypothetical protein OF83DRAFT_1103606 [Amylostereum chailletii]